MGNENTTAAKIEIRYSPASRSVSSDIARDIANNHLHGDIVIVCAGNPAFAHAAFRKQWMHVQRTLEREQASTFNAARISELADQIAKMKTLSFGTTPAPNTVLFTTVKTLIKNPYSCRLIYLTHPISDHLLEQISRKSSADTIVRYLRPELKTEHAAIRQHPWRLPM